MTRAPEHGTPTAGHDALAEALGHTFENPQLLMQALTHASAAATPGQSNERLEFLGDRVLGLTLAGMLYETFADEQEGSLGVRFASLAKRDSLARVADAIALGDHLVLSAGERGTGGSEKAGLLADACEAVIGALYLDGGLAAAAAFIERHWRPLLEEDPVPPKDPKTALQEWAQGHGHHLPVYEVTGREGPDHSPVFTVRVSVHGREPETGSGSSKRDAERAAAEAMLSGLATVLKGEHDG